MSILLIVIILLVLFTFAKYLKKLRYWKHYNGETIGFFKVIRRTLQEHTGLVLKDIYQRSYEEKIPFKVLVAPFMTVVIVQDLELIKQIMVTNFDDFPDRGFYTNHKDPLSTNLIRLERESWKPLRQKLSPLFTPSKMKSMIPTFSKIAEQLMEVLRDEIGGAGSAVIPIHDICARFTIDSICNAAFGIECNSLKDPECAFRRQGLKVFDYNWHPALDSLAAQYRKFSNFLNIKLFKKEITQFFTSFVGDVIEHREANNIRRPDLMDALIELKRQDQKNSDGFVLTIELIVGQVFGFFGAGFETSSNTLGYILYELAKNQDIQDKARQSIQEIMLKYDKITYESLQEMVYLKQITEETLRKYPAAPYTVRVCRQTSVLKTNKTAVRIPIGTRIMIPIYGIHHNPDFYAEPQLFLPERFAEPELSNRKQGTYLPFGAGPRVCIGESFAVMQLKLILALLLTQFRFSWCTDTPRELDFNPLKTIVLSTKQVIKLKVEMVEKE